MIENLYTLTMSGTITEKKKDSYRRTMRFYEPTPDEIEAFEKKRSEHLIRERRIEPNKKVTIKGEVFVFKNKGEEVGSSISHPHMQIYGMPFVPSVIDREIENSRNYFNKTGESLLLLIYACKTNTGL